MRPEQFIREQGLDKAREVVESASENHNKFDIALDKTVEAYKVRPKLVDLHYLKRLVESLDLFKELKTKKNANREFMKACMRGQTERANQIKRAIEAQDAVFGGKGASHE